MTAYAIEPGTTLADLPARLQDLVRATAAALVSDPTKDKAYLGCQLGEAVASYLSWKNNEDGAAAATLDTYERILARLCIQIDKPATAVTPDDIRAVRDTFPPGSRRVVTGCYKDFFKWLYEESLIRENPAGRVRYPKREKPVVADMFDDVEKAAIVTAQTDIMDRALVLLFLRAGLRKSELRLLRVRDVNLIEKYIVVRRGKGGKGRTVPIKGQLVRALEELMLTPIETKDGARARKLDDYVIAPRHGGRARYYAPTRPMSQHACHTRWYACLQRAGIVDTGVESGRRMHGARHTYATDTIRATGGNMVAAQKNLGHSSISVTVDLYTHLDFDDQAAAVGMLPEIGDEDW